MKKFEYLTIEKGYSHKIFSNEEDLLLKTQGLLGWELVSVMVTAPMTNLNKTIYYFKREIRE